LSLRRPSSTHLRSYFIRVRNTVLQFACQKACQRQPVEPGGLGLKALMIEIDTLAMTKTVAADLGGNRANTRLRERMRKPKASSPGCR
jgi:hypothetical protein